MRGRLLPSPGGRVKPLPGRWEEYFHAATLLYMKGLITDGERMKVHKRMTKKFHVEHPEWTGHEWEQDND